MIKLVRALVLAALAAFAFSLRHKPFAWEGSDAAARVSEGRVMRGIHAWFTPEAGGDRLLAGVFERSGARGLSLLGAGLFAAAAVAAVAAGGLLGGFPAAAALAAVLLPLGMGDAAPGPWLFSAGFAALFLLVHGLGRSGAWPPAAYALWIPLALAWPLFHRAGAVYAPWLALMCWWDAIIYRRSQDNAVEGGVYTSAPDPLLFREDELDRAAFLRILGWETKMNQFVHQRLGLTPAQLPSLSLGRAVEVLNGLLDIPDLPQQAAVPDPGVTDGNVRARNRRLLDIHYKDALRAVQKPAFGLKGPVAEAPLNVLSPTIAAAAAAGAAMASPAGISSLFRMGESLMGHAATAAAPAGWWIWGPRGAAPGLPYHWLALALLVASSAFGAARNRARFSEAALFCGLVLWLSALTAPGAAPLVAAALIPLAAAPLRGLWKDDTPVRALTGAAVLIATLTLVLLADWDRLPVGAPPAAEAAAR